MASVLLRANLLLLLTAGVACFEAVGLGTSECASDDDDADVAFLAQLRVRRQSELSKDSPSKIVVNASEFEASESANAVVDGPNCRIGFTKVQDYECLYISYYPLPIASKVMYCKQGSFVSCGSEPEATCVDFQKPNPCAVSSTTTTAATTTTTTTTTTTSTTETTSTATTTASLPFEMLIEGSGGMCLNYNFNTGDAYGAGCTGGGNQLWRLDDQQRLVVKTGGGSKCLEVNSPSNSQGPDVVVNSCSDSGYQKWKYDPATLSFKCPSHSFVQCLDYDDKGSYNKTNIYMHDCLGQKTNQEWTWTAATTTTSTTETTSTATTTASLPFEMLIEGSGGMCLNYNFNTGDAYGAGCTGGGNQLWRLDDQQRLVVKTGGGSKCLEVNSPSNSQGPDVVVNSCSDSGYQKWTYDPATLSFKCPYAGNQCLDYDDKGSYNKANIYMHDCLGQKTNQEWTWTPCLSQLFFCG
ncbi:unnamed protein product [Polarella glacialis]|uniref:Ricin B lectin domain-containing protein n=1 Tax=Polarella glacialis TaxID=89957 RepID=A0A813D5N6_POLGL|nr:unnamed protein product [Polarella glacialis]